MNKFLGKSQKGFTLIELMIVVAIIGILAAIAIPNFVRFQLKAKTSEGKVNLAAIRTAEEAFFSEFGDYVAASVSPESDGGTTKTTFVGVGDGFGILGWAPEGQVYFNYEVVLSSLNNKAYTADAGADIDGNGTKQAWGYIHPVPGEASSNATALIAGGVCPKTGILVNGTKVFNQVLPCDPTFGQSEF
jgi:type IV pilus assembly protein PilA